MTKGILETKDYKTFRVGDVEFTGNASKALPGDTVIVEDGAVTSLVKRANHKGLVGVLEVSSKTRYGFTCRKTPIYLFIPWNEAYPPFYVGSNHSTAEPVLAVVDFEIWDGNCPRGNCRFIIGPSGYLESEEKALLLHACPNPWKKSIIPPQLLPRLWEPTQLVKGTTFHVDPEGCRDIDDAITFVGLESGLVEVYIHIADVATLLAPNESLWRAAELGQTLYKDGKVVAGLFPESVERTCSLIPLEIHPTLTLKFVWNPVTGTISETTWHHVNILVKESYTYETICDSWHARLLENIASAMAGKPVTDSHDWIAQFMLFYNREAAAVLRKAQKGVLRKHGAPDMDMLKVLEKLEQVPEYLAFQAGKYCEATDPDVFHWGLQAGFYCHASSPIRRWADCVNQICIMEAVFGYEFAAPPVCPEELNRLSKVSKRYENDLFFVKNLLSAGLKPFQATVVECSAERARIWVEKWAMLLKISKPIQGWGFEPVAGQRVTARIFVDSKQRNWKRRLVITLSGR